ncbi:hypothetical protein B0H13DRAFT_1857208 [Mycena leptocephala]|nr:hypothetical protein B0H13DRAFT_1857208 [Mycena leptocephala]
MLDTIDPSREMICGSVDYFHRTDINLPVSNNYESQRTHFSGMDVEGEGGAIALVMRFSLNVALLLVVEEVPRTGGNTLAHALSWPLGLRRKPTKCAEYPTLASRYVAQCRKVSVPGFLQCQLLKRSSCSWCSKWTELQPFYWISISELRQPVKTSLYLWDENLPVIRAEFKHMLDGVLPDGIVGWRNDKVRCSYCPRLIK